LQEHRGNIGETRTAWSRMLETFKATLSSNLVSSFIEGAWAKMQGFFNMTINGFMKFESGFSNVLTNLNEADTKQYGDALRSGTKEVIKLGVAVDDANKAMFDAVSAGVPAAEAVGFLNDAAKLSIGGVSKLAESVDILTTIQNAYNQTAEESAQNAGKIFTAQLYGKTTVSELSSSLGKAIPLAKTMGISIDEVLAATSSLTLNGIKTADSVTFLNGAFKALLKPSKESIPILESLGIPLGVTAVRAEGLGSALAKFQKAMKENPDIIAQAVPDLEGMSAILNLTGDGFERYNEILAKVSNNTEANASLTRAYEIKQATRANIIEKVKSSITVMAIELGEKLAPMFEKVVLFVGSFTTSLMNGVNWMIKHSSTILSVAKALAYLGTIYATYHIGQKLGNAINTIWIGLQKVRLFLTQSETVAVQRFTFAQASASAAQSRLNTVTKLYNTIVKANPWGFALAAVTTLTIAVIALGKKQDDISKNFVEFMAEGATAQAKATNLFEMAMKAGEGTERRKDLISQINKEYGEYLGYMLDETSSLDRLQQAQAAVNAELYRTLLIKTKTAETERVIGEAQKEIASQSEDILQNALDINPNTNTKVFREELDKAVIALEKMGYGTDNFTGKLSDIKKITQEFEKALNLPAQSNVLSDRSIPNIIKERKVLNDQLKRIDALYGTPKEKRKVQSESEMQAEYDALVKSKQTGTGTGTGKTRSVFAATQNADQLEQYKKDYEKWLKELAQLREKANATELTDLEKQFIIIEQRYQDELQKLKEKEIGIEKVLTDQQLKIDNIKKELSIETELQKKQELQAKLTEELRIQSIYETQKIDLIKQNIQIRKGLDIQYFTELTDAEIEANKKLAEARQTLAERMSEITGNDLIKTRDANIKKYESIVELNQKAGYITLKQSKEIADELSLIRQQEVTDTQQAYEQELQALDLMLEKKLINETQYNNMRKKVTEERENQLYDTREKYGLNSLRQQMDKEKSLLEDEYKKGLLTYEEYQRARFDISMKYLDKSFDIGLNIYNDVMNLVNIQDEIDANKAAARLKKKEDAAAREKTALDNLLKAKYISEAEHNKQVAAIDKKLANEKAKQERAAALQSQKKAIFDIGINTASGLVKIWSEAGINVILGGIMSGLLIGTSLMQVQKIKSEPLPEVALAKGGRIDKPTVALIGEAGAEEVFPNSMLNDSTTGPIINALAKARDRNIPFSLPTPAMPRFAEMQTATKNMSINKERTSNLLADKMDKFIEISYKQKKELSLLKTFLSDPNNRKATLSFNDLQKANRDNETITKKAKL